MPRAFNSLERRRRGWFHRVGDGEEAGKLLVDRNKHNGCAASAERFGVAFQRVSCDAEFGQEIFVAERHPFPRHCAEDAFSSGRIEVGRRERGDIALGRRSHYCRGQRMLARALDAGSELKDAAVIEPTYRGDGDDFRLALGQRAGLVDNERVDFFHALQDLGVFDQDAKRGRAADADHDRHRCRQTERARAGNDQNADGGDERVGKARLRPERRPGRECDERDRNHRRHKPGRNLVGQPGNRGARALRGGHHVDDARQHCVAADLFGAHHEAAAAVERAADHTVAGRFSDRHQFSRHHQLVDRGAAVKHNTVDWNLLAWPNAKLVADENRIKRYVLVTAVDADTPRIGRRKTYQRTDGAGCRSAGGEFQYLTQQHQNCNDGRGFEVKRKSAVCVAESCGE